MRFGLWFSFLFYPLIRRLTDPKWGVRDGLCKGESRVEIDRKEIKCLRSMSELPMVKQDLPLHIQYMVVTFNHSSPPGEDDSGDEGWF